MTVALGERILGRFRHEHDAGEEDDLGLGFAGFEAEEVRVALEITDAVDDLGLDVRMGEEDGVFFFFEVVNLEGERGDFPASLVVPFFTARVAFDVEQGFEQAFGFAIEFGGGGGV